MGFENVTPEQMEKAKNCKTTEELVELAKDEGVELTDAQIEAIAGGEEWYSLCDTNEGNCPKYKYRI